MFLWSYVSMWSSMFLSVVICGLYLGVTVSSVSHCVPVVLCHSVFLSVSCACVSVCFCLCLLSVWSDSLSVGVLYLCLVPRISVCDYDLTSQCISVCICVSVPSCLYLCVIVSQYAPMSLCFCRHIIFSGILRRIFCLTRPTSSVRVCVCERTQICLGVGLCVWVYDLHVFCLYMCGRVGVCLC